MLRREGWRANHKRVERLYREEGLSLRRRRRRKRLSHLRVMRARPVAPNQTWAVDFIHDSLFNGLRFRAFAVLDEWSRESLAIEVDVSLTGERVTRVLERLSHARGLPSVIQADNGPEFRSRALDQWAYEHGVKLQFIAPGKPIQNAYEEFAAKHEMSSAAARTAGPAANQELAGAVHCATASDPKPERFSATLRSL
jgi:putative transposase